MRTRAALLFLTLVLGACAKRSQTPSPQAKAFGTAIIMVSGEKQAGGVGAALDQPVVVQVNDAKGTAVAGALVQFRGAQGMAFQPVSGLTGADGQFTTTAALGGVAGRYRILARTMTSAGKPAEVAVEEIALGYQATLGLKVNQIHCVRCHDSESTPERVSNHDNLDPMPHAFTEGAVLNGMSDASLSAIIAHGGAGLSKSPAMPPYGNTLTPTEIDAVVAYLRAVSDPPYRQQGVFYAAN
jgi:mono/diheme cytochrome c family protein